MVFYFLGNQQEVTLNRITIKAIRIDTHQIFYYESNSEKKWNVFINPGPCFIATYF